MTTWQEFSAAAPKIAAIFTRRHAAAGNLCMLATLRSDGFPRISPIEPRIADGQLWLEGMPDTLKFRDLERDPRFCLHTATVDTHVSDGDAKLWGVVFDVDGKPPRQPFAVDVTGASALEVADGHLDVTIWRPGEPERVVRKH